MGSGPMSGPPGAGGGMMNQPVNESLQISVPNSAVGAIIGAGGANIKQIMRDSGAFVNVSILSNSPADCVSVKIEPCRVILTIF